MSGAPRFPRRQRRKPFLDLFERARARGLRVGVMFRDGRASAITLSNGRRLIGARIPWGDREETMFDPVGDAALALQYAGGVA